MPKFRLRYQATDLELPVGDFVIGRSSSCNLALDDALVSRRHATLHASEERVTVEDLGSRNGVQVNGERIRGMTQISHLDRVTIGSQELVLIEVGRARPTQRDTGIAMRCLVCGALIPPDSAFCTGCGAPATPQKTLAGQTIEMPVPAGVDPDDVTRQATGFTLLAGIADKALALGRFDEAQRILEKHLERLLERAKEGDMPQAATLAKGTTYALKIARGLRAAKWVDWVFQTHATVRTVPPADLVADLHEVVREIGYNDARELRAYLAQIRPLRDKLTASERFVLSRLEGLERVISA